MLKCAQKLLDTADIVRDVDFMFKRPHLFALTVCAGGCDGCRSLMSREALGATVTSELTRPHPTKVPLTNLHSRTSVRIAPLSKENKSPVQQR
jgi:hypothetical protein